MNIKNLQLILQENNQPSFRIKQIIKAVYQDGILDFNKINNIPKTLKEILKDFPTLSFEVLKVNEGIDSKKILLKLNDGNLIESVLIKNSSGWTVCLSTQAGCPINCAFCATGQNGFKRNLTSEEITDQILYWKNFLKTNNAGLLTNIVYMGMGEPFINYDNMIDSVSTFTDKDLFNIGDRNISVSTSFPFADRVEKFAKKFPQVNIAISLHFANNDKRSEYMPINKKSNLQEIKKFIVKYIEHYNKKIFLEYTMMDGINDTEYDAKKLIKFIEDIDKKYLVHVNLIKYNSTYKNFAASKKEKIVKFENLLKRAGIPVTLRKSLGADINGACGQLAGKNI